MLLLRYLAISLEQYFIWLFEQPNTDVLYTYQLQVSSNTDLLQTVKFGITYTYMQAIDPSSLSTKVTQNV